MENINFSGCLKPKKDLRNYRIKATASQIDNLPEEFELPKYQKVKNQGSIGSCVPHAMSSVLEYHNQGKNELSVIFLYGIKKKLCGDEGRGMYMSDVCKIVSEYGDMLEDDCEGNYEPPTAWYAAEAAFNDEEKRKRALTFRLKSYFSCQTENDVKVAL